MLPCHWILNECFNRAAIHLCAQCSS